MEAAAVENGSGLTSWRAASRPDQAASRWLLALPAIPAVQVCRRLAHEAPPTCVAVSAAVGLAASKPAAAEFGLAVFHESGRTTRGRLGVAAGRCAGGGFFK